MYIYTHRDIHMYMHKHTYICIHIYTPISNVAMVKIIFLMKKWHVVSSCLIQLIK